MSRTTFSFTNSTTIPHPPSTTASILLSTNPAHVSRVLLLSPIASKFTHTRSEPVHIPPPTTPPSVSSFPTITPADADHPANGTRVHFTYVETVTLLFGLYKFSFPLEGWFAAREGEEVGYAEIVASPERPMRERTVVRKVRWVQEEEGGTRVVEELEVDIRWGAGWIAKGTAKETHVAYVGRYGELFQEER